MRPASVCLALTIAAIAILAPASPLTAQVYEVVHAFSGSAGAPSGPVVEMPDGTLYATAAAGGIRGWGSIAKMSPDGHGGYDFTEIHSFTGADGAFPQWGLVLASDGYLYGTTSSGGTGSCQPTVSPSGCGTVFRVDPRGRVTVIHQFDDYDGRGPSGPLIERIGYGLYGTTATGGAAEAGTIFKIALDLGLTFTSLHSFAIAEGVSPGGGLALAGDGSLYGACFFGGAGSVGSIFRIDPSDGFTVVHAFVDEGGNPTGLAQTNDGSFLGTMAYGGSGGGGIFRMDASGDTTIVHWFDASEGSNPMAGPIKRSDGLLYGTTQNGGAFGYGTVFRLDESGVPTTLHHFQSTDGARPASPLGIGAGGELLGAVPEGGEGLHGTVFRIDGAGVFSTLHEFARAEGLFPRSALLQSADGTFWGTTAGNSDEGGTVYRFSLADGFATIHTFTGPDGAHPEAELMRASNGQLYGTTQDGGSNGLGTIFTIDDQNVLTTLHSFDGTDGAIPEAGLVQASDGNLYGTASGGGAQGSGTAFRMTLDGDFLSLHDFEVAVDGQTPKGSLIQASDGDLYGTTETGDVYGTVIRMDTAGNVTKIHAFSVSAEGAFPEDGVMQASDGKLYGTEQTGGIFRIDGTGDFFDFGPPLPGYQLFARPVQALDGDLYGTTAYGGFTDRGTLYRMTLAGLVIPLYEFSPWDTGGMYPSQRLIQAADGNLYGVAGDGAGLSGVLFRWLSTTPSAVIDRIAPTSGHFDGASAAVIGSHFAIQTPVKVGVLPGIAPVTIDQGTITLIMPSLVPGTLNDVTIPDRDGSTVTLTGAWFVDFFDVNSLHIFHDYVETIFRAGITAGYGNGYYGIDDPVSRAQMAVFLLKGEHGGSYTPPPCTGIFVDVECTPAPAFAVDWIEQLSHEEITAGCTDSVHYCPDQPIPRSQMAVFLLKAEHGSGYVPPACKGEFLDVPCPATPDFPYSDWVEQLASEGITAGCGPELFCPDQAVTRGQMAVFLVRTFPLP